MAKVLYDFAGQKENELSIKAGDIVEIVQKENNGKLLPALRMVASKELRRASLDSGSVCRGTSRSSSSSSGPRAPPAPPAAKAKPTPPGKRPVAGRKPADLAHRDSGMSLNGNGSDGSRSNTPTPSLGGSLADALLARQKAMQRREDGEEDW
ncbi:Myosin-1 [Cladobotryum mycophilum]|uniref:Myosin-1 n=1 Tax=Cladobotryum mycophilum TaxID=491253 RepID=A0ABR0SLD0_9HYPO